MESKVVRQGQTEIGIVSHGGRDFAALGASVSGGGVTGYLGKGGTLTGWGGRVMLAGRFEVVAKFRDHNGDPTQAVVWLLTRGRAIAGYSLGVGMLVRAELCGPGEGAAERAKDIARHWLEVDADDAERFSAECEQELSCDAD